MKNKEEKNEKENIKKITQKDINQQENIIINKNYDEVKEFEEKSKEEKQKIDDIKRKQKYFEKEENDDDNSSFSSASISFSSTENININNSLTNSFNKKTKIERQYSKKSLQYSVKFKENCFIQSKEENKNNKNSMQLISKLFGFICNKLNKCSSSLCCAYALKEKTKENTKNLKNIPNRGGKKRKSSIRKPKLLCMRQRESSIIFNKSENQKQIFERLLTLYNTPKDVVILKNNPEPLIQLGIDSKQFSTIFEELYFFLQKSEQLKEAEQRINERKERKRKRKI